METELETYHRIMLLAANLVATGERPMHIANTTKVSIGSLARLFEALDDGTISLIPNAQTVGAHTSRAEPNLPSVIVI